MSESRDRQSKMLGYEQTYGVQPRQQSFNLVDGVELTLYTEKDFKGHSLTIKYEVNDLGQWKSQFNNSVSSIVVGKTGEWTLYRGARYQGTQVKLTEGRYPDLGVYGLNDAVSSIDLSLPEPPPRRPRPMLILFSEKNLDGSELSVSFDEPDLRASRLNWQNFNDSASSALVFEGTWTLYQHVDFQGTSMRLEPGYYPDLGVYGLNNAVSSVSLDL